MMQLYVWRMDILLNTDIQANMNFMSSSTKWNIMAIQFCFTFYTSL